MIKLDTHTSIFIIKESLRAVRTLVFLQSAIQEFEVTRFKWKTRGLESTFRTFHFLKEVDTLLILFSR